MPESPEVTLVAQQLHALLGDAKTKFVSVSFLNGRYTTKKPFKGYAQHLQPHLPALVARVTSKGKYLAFELASGHYVGHSFGLTGSWRLYALLSPEQQRDDVRMLFNFQRTDDNTALNLAYLDSNNYGYFTAFGDVKSYQKKLNTIGEPIQTATLQHYFAKFTKAQKRKPKMQITTFLMNQAWVSGLGNYLKCDVLHEAKLSPRITLGALDVSDVTRLFLISQSLYMESFEAHGSPHYTDIYGKAGRYTFKIYKLDTARIVHTEDNRNTYTMLV